MSIPNKTDAFEQLENKVRDIGHPQYPFLSKTYSPMSRVPAADYSDFIKAQLKRGDEKSILMLMRNIIEANPGVGLGVGADKYSGYSWTDGLVKEVNGIDFNKYIQYSDMSACWDIKSLWILACKDGGGREFWITEKGNVNSIFATAMAGYNHKLTSEFPKLVQSANSFIREMRKDDIPYWQEYPLFKEIEKQELSSPLNQTRTRFLNLSIGARVVLCSATRKVSGNLTDCSTYSQRNIGINADQVADELYNSGLMKGARETLAIPEPQMEFITKAQMTEFCTIHNVEVKKSWDKDKIYKTIQQTSAQLAHDLVKDLPKIHEVFKFEVAPECEDELNALPVFAEKLFPIYQVLCFVNFKLKKSDRQGTDLIA